MRLHLELGRWRLDLSFGRRPDFGNVDNAADAIPDNVAQIDGWRFDPLARERW
jgi:hypothetical protein